MLMCGLLRSNFSFAMFYALSNFRHHRSSRPRSPTCVEPRARASGLFRYFALDPADDLLGQILRNFLVTSEVHRETSAALRTRTKIRRIAKHLAQRNTGFDYLGCPLNQRPLESAPA